MTNTILTKCSILVSKQAQTGVTDGEAPYHKGFTVGVAMELTWT